MINDDEKHILSIGKLISNLQSLEFLLRGFLATIYDSDSDGLIPGMPKDMYDLQAGQTVPINHITNYESLRQIIDKYNDYVKEEDISLLLNRQQLVDLRDAMAHGRVSSAAPTPLLKILKFDRPDGGQARVMLSQTMDDAWFKSQISLVYESIMRIYHACELFAPIMIV